MPISTTLPYSSEALAAFVANYHQAIWPLQLIVALGILTTLFFLFRPHPYGTRLIGLILSAFWLWTGIVFYFQAFSRLSFWAPIYGIAFLLQAVLLVVFLVARGDYAMGVRPDRAGWTGALLLLAALAIYPVGVMTYERQWTSYRLVGVTPVATSLYTLSFIAWLQASRGVKMGLGLIPGLHILACAVTAGLLLSY